MENTATNFKTEIGGKICQYCKRIFDDSKILKHATFQNATNNTQIRNWTI